MLPVALRRIAFGNCYQAGYPGFGCQQIVVTRVKLFGVYVVTDMEHLAVLIEQKAKIHGTYRHVRLPCQVSKSNQHRQYRHLRRR